MSNQAQRLVVLGMLSEEGEECLELAKKVESELLDKMKELIKDDCDKLQGARVLGITLAMFSAEKLIDKIN